VQKRNNIGEIRLVIGDEQHILIRKIFEIFSAGDGDIIFLYIAAPRKSSDKFYKQLFDPQPVTERISPRHWNEGTKEAQVFFMPGQGMRSCYCLILHVSFRCCHRT
jgi:hypothetical protein